MISNLWIEKYRPKTFQEVKGQEEIVKRVKAFVESGNIPHMLFMGKPGIGKTTLAGIVAHELFGEDKAHNFLELNSSDERGIDVVRMKVKDFARTKALTEGATKVIFLDECDALTREAQQALRRTMETYASSCRFILSCNFSSKIIDPIKSRCAIFKFKPLNKENLKELVKEIAINEGLTISEETADLLINEADGDVRQLENILQSCAVLSKDVTPNLIKEIVSSAEPKGLKEALEIAMSGDFNTARLKLIDAMLNNGLSGVDVIKHIQKEVWSLNIKDESKLKLIEKCGEVEFRLVEGADEIIQLESLLASFCLLKQ
ncbi:MAG: replication factor C small subunit [Candidatus Nanoarchaeia archaeon]